MKLPVPKIYFQNAKAFYASRLARAQEAFRKRPRSFWIWASAVGFVALICLFLLYRIFFVLPDELEREAVARNRRVTIDLGSGDVVGGQHSQSAISETLFKSNKTKSSTLNPAPYDAITESTSHGPLPRISGDTLPWEYYSKNFTSKTRNPQIAIILSDLGTQANDIDDAINLPQQITFSLSPYIVRVQDLSDHLRGLGFETMVNVPLQTGDYPYSDPGPYAIVASKNDATNLAALQQALSRFSGYIGGVAADDEVMTGSDQAVPMMKELSKRGVAFVYAKNERNSPHWDGMIFSNVWPGYPADITIDKEKDPEHIKQALKLLTETVKKQYFAVAIIHSYPVSLRLLKEWLPTLEKQKIELVPFSAIAKQKHRVFEIKEELPPPPPKKKKKKGEEEDHSDPFAKAEKKPRH